MSNDSEMLGEWVNQGYFLKEYYDDILVCYKDNGSRELASFNQNLATPDALQDVCKRHQATLVEEVAK